MDGYMDGWKEELTMDGYEQMDGQMSGQIKRKINMDTLMCG